MDKNLITLDELQLYVTSQSNTNNDRVKTFLNNVFQMGFSFKYFDIVRPIMLYVSFKRINSINTIKENATPNATFNNSIFTYEMGTNNKMASTWNNFRFIIFMLFDK